MSGKRSGSDSQQKEDEAAGWVGGSSTQVVDEDGPRELLLKPGSPLGSPPHCAKQDQVRHGVEKSDEALVASHQGSELHKAEASLRPFSHQTAKQSHDAVGALPGKEAIPVVFEGVVKTLMLIDWMPKESDQYAPLVLGYTADVLDGDPNGPGPPSLMVALPPPVTPKQQSTFSHGRFVSSSDPKAAVHHVGRPVAPSTELSPKCQDVSP